MKRSDPPASGRPQSSGPQGSRSQGMGRIPGSARQVRILDLVGRDGFVSVSQIAADLGVSEMTIRRDLVSLEEKGLLTRTHGGALAAQGAVPEIFDAEEPQFDQRRRRNAAAKAMIAAEAARLIGPRETIGLDVGTTVLALADEIAVRSDLRFFTNNVRAAIRLAGSRSPVYLLGGQLRDSELSLIGAGVVAQVREYFFDRVFIGVSGIIEAGLYDYSLEDSEVKRALIERAGEVVVLCDASKFDHHSLARVCDWDAVDVLVTNLPPPPHLAATLDAAEVRVIVAGASDPV